MLDFNKSTTVKEACVSLDYTAEETAHINRFKSKHLSTLKKRNFRKQLTEKNKEFLKLIGLLK